MAEIKKNIGEIEIPPLIVEDIKREVKNIPDFTEKIGKSLNKNITDLVQIILTASFFLEGSDIHIEPEPDRAKFRLRVDGVLHDVFYFDRELYKKLISRLKLLSGLKLNVTSRPQDGRFSIFIEGTSIEIRTSIIPAERGESLVIRILNPKWVVTMADLGLREDLMETFKKEIQKPNGMIICTGPTGSGKTTTLYAFLKEIANPEIKIITIEDPIEYHLEGVSQTQVDEKKGYDFANGLRAIVRQDPDVILIGEIRDLETAQIALQAALTGHLVLSTVHTNDAAGTIARLQALGEKPANIAPAINMAIGQRLVREVCLDCFELKEATNEELENFQKSFEYINKEKVKIPEVKPGIKIPHAKGCRNCNFTGYKGRIGIFEAFVVDDEMERFILQSPSIIDMKELAIKKGMVLLREDGLIKVLNDITTIDEVERVAGQKEEIII
ncbi:MAG TPA: GspE/PulE family protein [Candidatus Pacearchaeota archaeon]|nr:GspE/PulE family protein [Candidatus Pacearchaeota archaeon]